MSFNHEGSYVCSCGKTFTSSQAFNGHKSHCVVHLSLTGRLEQRQLIDQHRGPQVGALLAHKSKMAKQTKLDTWLAEQHTCERCGKIMTKYYGSGRFCSENCARSNPRSADTKAKIAKSLKKSARTNPSKISEISRKRYLDNPKFCVICENMLPYELRYRSTCSDECKSKLLSRTSQNAVLRNGGNLNSKPNRNARRGYYKNIWCDSSWELAFLVYCLDHNIPIKRNTENFTYIFKGTQHKYYPDFKVNNTYIEIKNYINEMVQAKIDYFPYKDRYKLLLQEDLRLCIDYCKTTYGIHYWEVLYD